jgi:hypothetical protein
MYLKIRDLVLWLANEQKAFDQASKIVRICSEVFAYLPRAVAQMEEEAAVLLDLKNQQLAEELLSPLAAACESAQKSHRVLEQDLLRSGFGRNSNGAAKHLYDSFVSAVQATKGLPFSDVPWRLVRDVAISLNNDSSAPAAAAVMIDGLHELASESVAAEIMKSRTSGLKHLVVIGELSGRR